MLVFGHEVPLSLASSESVQPAKQDGARGESPAHQIEKALVHDDPSEAVKLATPLAAAGESESQLILALLTDVGAGAKLDHAKALEWLQKAAAQGDLRACSYLSWKYQTGFGLEKPDPAESTRWAKSPGSTPVLARGLGRWLSLKDGSCVPNFQRAFLWLTDQASANNVVAQSNLAQAYLEKYWTAPDTSQHLYWLQQAAAKQDVTALETLADYYAAGLFVAQNTTQAAVYRRAVAEAGSANAQFALGKQYDDGDGVTASGAEAAKWYRLAVAQGNTDALLRLISLLRNGGPDLAPDFNEAFQLAEAGAKQGNAEAIADLADLYNRGEGTPVNFPKSAELYREAADKGVVRAMSMLGWMIQNNEITPPDYAEARKWDEMAAAKGNQVGMRLLGLLYENGLGMDKNASKAFEWCERAARGSDSWAQNHLGWMLRQGIGVERDDEEAVTWFRLAVKNGEPLGDANLGYHYWNGLGVPKEAREAFVHLAAALMEIDDSWPASVLSDLLFKCRAEERDSLKDLLLATLADPKLPQAKGNLPEVCLSAVTTFYPQQYHAEVAAALSRLAEANRTRSAAILAWHSFIAWDMPYDLPRARQWARDYAAIDARKSSYLLAYFDSVAAESPADRAAANRVLRQLADDGFSEAAFTLAHRLATGECDTLDPDGAVHYFNLAVGKKPGETLDSIKAVRRLLGLTAPKQGPSDTELAGILQALPDAGPDARPKPIYQCPTLYPFELRPTMLTGNVHLEFVINTAGHVENLRVLDSTNPLFSRSAEAAVSQWRFTPARKNNHLVKTRVTLPVIFNIQDLLVPDSTTTRVRTTTTPSSSP